MNRKNNGRNLSRSVVFALSVAGFLCIAGTAAFTVHRLETENIMQSHKMDYSTDLSVDENFPDKTVTPGGVKTKWVQFKNDSSAPVFLRVCCSETWETQDEILTGVDGVTKYWSPEWLNDWTEKDDGWWYYKYVLPAGATTAAAMTGVKFPQTVPEGAGYSLSFIAEAVQVSDEDEVNTHATEALYGRAGTVSNAELADGAVIYGEVDWD